MMTYDIPHLYMSYDNVTLYIFSFICKSLYENNALARHTPWFQISFRLHCCCKHMLPCYSKGGEKS